jgi:regulator of RNase E activity RraA
VCGGQLVNPGDIVVGDQDGIVFIRPEYAREVYEKTLIAKKKEEMMLKELEETGSMTQTMVWNRLKEIGCTIV